MRLTLDRIEGSRSVVVEDSIDRVWAMLHDPTRFAEWSPTVEDSSWIPPDAGPVVGARFESRNRLPIVRRWTSVSTITRFDPPHALTFVVGRNVDDPNNEWSFELLDLGGRTQVAESWRMTREPWVVRLFYRVVAQDRRIAASVEDTLRRLAEAVTADSSDRRNPPR